MATKVIIMHPGVVYVAVRRHGSTVYIGGIWWREEDAKAWVADWTEKYGKDEVWAVLEYGVLGEP